METPPRPQIAKSNNAYRPVPVATPVAFAGNGTRGMPRPNFGNNSPTPQRVPLRKPSNIPSLFGPGSGRTPKLGFNFIQLPTTMPEFNTSGIFPPYVPPNASLVGTQRMGIAKNSMALKQQAKKANVNQMNPIKRRPGTQTQRRSTRKTRKSRK
jgi:hypothetical protein